MSALRQKYIMLSCLDLKVHSLSCQNTQEEFPRDIKTEQGIHRLYIEKFLCTGKKMAQFSCLFDIKTGNRFLSK